MSNPNRQVFEYRGPRIAERYNGFFNPNICHVCKSRNNDNLIICDRCCLISYCNQEHKAEHYKEHKQICANIASALKAKPQVYTRKFSSRQEWLKSRTELLKTVQDSTCRPLQLYEKHMIIWAKSCIVCYQQVNLQTCEKCLFANYCNEHASVFRTKHDEAKCDRLMLSLNVDLGLISSEADNLSYNFFFFIKEERCMETMLEFYIEYVLTSRKDLDWFTKDYIQSDYLSGPLTIYSGLRRNTLLHMIKREIVIIYVIGDFFINELSLTPWEVLFHLVPKVRKLVIIMIDPKLVYDYRVHNLCGLCTNGNRKLIFISVPTLYHDFIFTHPLYDKPHVTISLHADGYTEDAWLKSMEVISNKFGPLFLTYINADKASAHVMKIHKTLQKNAELIFSGRNYFSGLSPCRCADTGDTIFVNDYLIIYKKSRMDVSKTK